MSEDIKEKILSKSHEMFRMYGIKSVSMDDIAHQLSISKKTLYQHFSSKEELLTDATNKIIEQLFNKFRVVSDSNEAALVKLSLIYFYILKELTNFELVYLHTVNIYSDKVSDLIKKFQEDITAEFTIPLLEEARNDGWIEPGADLSLFERIYLRRIDMVYAEAVNIKTSLSIQQLFHHLVIVPISGICSHEKLEEYTMSIARALA